MTIEQLLNQLGNYSQWIIGFLIVMPILAWFIGFFYKKPIIRISIWDYLYSILIYLVSIPGIIACLLTAYTLFISHQNLLQVDLILYILPIISMLVTLAIIGKKASFNDLPGFDRLSGLMMIITITFIIILFVLKLRILIGFFSSIQNLVIFGIILFFILKLSMKKLLK